MPISWWLTPKFFDINVILVAVMINWTLWGIASNFLEDFHIPPKFQAANYFGVVLMSAAYAVLVLIMEPVETLYPNPYDWLLIGNWPVLGSVLFGLFGGIVTGYLFGDRDRLRTGAAAAAVLCEGLIGLFTILWLISQT